MTTATVEAETKTMAALAEILRAEGVEVSQAIEEEEGAFQTPRITFHARRDSDALAVANVAEKHGYNVKLLVHKWLFVDHRPISPKWVVEFHRAGSKPLSFYSS